MGLPAAPSMSTFHAVATAVPVVAIIATGFRLYYRIRRKLAWWDDLLIAAASVWLALLVVAIWLSTTEGLAQKVKVAAYYLATFTFTLGNYFARLSILVGILRIAPNPRTRLALKVMAGFFVVILSVLMAQKVWVCDGNTEMAHTWKSEPDPACHLGMQVALTELVTDIISDALLIITPLTFLSRSKLKAAQKRRLYAIFCASVATTITSIVQDWLILAAGGLREETASMIEVAVAIIVANLPVIVSWIYRLRHKKEDATSTRFATDYDHNRRAKPTAWAGSRDLISSSDPASKQHLSSMGIQLSDVRRGTTVTAGGTDILDLRSTRKAADADDLSFDDRPIPGGKKGVEFDPELGERSFDSKHHRDRGDTDEMDFSVSAISYGGGRRVGRDAEYDIDIVDDLEHPYATNQGVMPIVSEKDSSLAYQPYPIENRPFAAPAPPGNVGGARDSYPGLSFPPPALAMGLSSRSSPLGAPGAPPMPSPPLPVSHRSPDRGPVSAMKRSDSTAQRLGRAGAGSEEGEGGRKSSRSRSPPTPASAVPLTRENRGVFGGLFGGGTGVLVQQQVTVLEDPEDDTHMQRGRR